MSYIVYKKFGNQEYAYEVSSEWDSAKKKVKKKSKYLGVVVDKKTKKFERREKQKIKNEKLILDYGDGYAFKEFSNTKGFTDLLKKIFPNEFESVLALIFYRLSCDTAMRHAEAWLSGNVLSLLFKESKVSSQRISELLEYLGEEFIQRQFCTNYINSFISSQGSLIIDSTGLPNQIHAPFTAWGQHDDGIDKQMKFLFVVDRKSSLPIYFRYLPGNIADVSTLETTIEELCQLDIKENLVLIDAGYYSESNLEELFKKEIDFLIRMPSNLKVYKEIILNNACNLENKNNIVKHSKKRALFVKEVPVKICSHDAFAYIVQDPERRGRELTKYLLKESKKESEEEFSMLNKGTMILLSSTRIDKEQVVKDYYTRQSVERLFGYSKDELAILPIRTHKEETIRGYLFLTFMTLIFSMFLKEKLAKEYTVEEMLIKMKNLKCKVYDKEVVPAELTKQHKEIIELLQIMVPKASGI